ncbi:MAG: acetyl-CoA carboxylase biotin carboxyl carrier protein [Lachnospiraceae bacterium]|nr:acetyl-CoA carboxylase biotin carboxyl carrier protein [Lachnospiraceae bacterium]
MEYNHILELIKTVSESNLTNFHYEEGNVKIHMSSGDVVMMDPGFSANTNATVAENATPAAQQSASETIVAEEVVAEKKVAANAKTINSPLVGTFYAAPSEDAQTFVKVGDRVKKGQIVAIVEAMKLMNEIESEYDGVITEILVDNATGVEYGEALFVVE